LRKGVYPYEFATSVEQLRACTRLPPHEDFYSKVANGNISDDEYRHAQTVWEMFQCNNMLDYTELYCKLDTLLLAECFLQFRNEVYSEFQLDCCHYISLPQLGFDCMLKSTGVKIEPLIDPDMVLFLEANIRGGTSFISQRHCLANPIQPNTGLPERIDEEPTTLVYIDANNLYGYAQSCPMPVGDYVWMERETFQQHDWRTFDENAEHGYIVECDMEYPEALHADHNSLPLAPHRMDITEQDLSPFSRSCLEKLRGDGKMKHRSRKLVSSFLPRMKYVVHAANLALYLQLGMVLTHVHRVLSFRQSLFLRSYINYCTTKRAEATSDFRKRLFKDFSNSNFGKVSIQ
jgi:DNA polymerase type B, organellar and viral